MDIGKTALDTLKTFRHEGFGLELFSKDSRTHYKVSHQGSFDLPGDTDDAAAKIGNLVGGLVTNLLRGNSPLPSSSSSTSEG